MVRVKLLSFKWELAISTKRIPSFSGRPTSNKPSSNKLYVTGKGGCRCGIIGEDVEFPVKIVELGLCEVDHVIVLIVIDGICKFRSMSTLCLLN